MVAQLDTAYITTRPARAVSRAVSYAFFEGRPLLTRGRWINPWLLRRAKKVAQREQSAVVDRPLFILGTGRSGTTVLGKILSMHREVGWLNEPKLMWHAACAHEDLNGNYTDAAADYRLAAADATPAVQRAMRNQYAAYLRATRNSHALMFSMASRSTNLLSWNQTSCKISSASASLRVRPRMKPYSRWL